MRVAWVLGVVVSGAAQADDLDRDGCDDAFDVAPNFPCVHARATVALPATLADGVVVGRRASIGPNSSLGSGSQVAPDVVAGSHLTLGPTAIVGYGATMGHHVTVNGLVGNLVDLGDYAVIGPMGRVGRASVVGSGTTAGDGVVIDGVVDADVQIGVGATIEIGARVRRGAVIAEDATIGAGGLVGRGATVYGSLPPTTRVPSNTVFGTPTVRPTLVSGARQWSNGTFATSCKAYRTPPSGYAFSGVDATSGWYRIDPDGPTGNAAFTAYCDQVTNGGGWTAVVQCLPSDRCRAGTGHGFYGRSWRTEDLGTVGDTTSYVQGLRLNAVTTAATQFMTEVRRVSTGATGYLVFPMFMPFFTGEGGFNMSESNDVSALVIDSNGSEVSRQMRVCWAGDNSNYRKRSYRPSGGMPFLGLTAGNPNPNASSNGGGLCSYGADAAQILVVSPPTDDDWAQTTSFGTTSHQNWSQSPYAHRVFVR
jgi:UDP-3-O-[3-hydroxymyristoyl] glucosamine N-acyltransferase